MISIHQLSNTDQLTGLKIKIQLSAVQESYNDVVQTCKHDSQWMEKTSKKKNQAVNKLAYQFLYFIKYILNKNQLRRYEDDNQTLIKITIHWEDISTVNIYAPNLAAPNFIKKKKRYHMVSDKMILGDFNILFSYLGGFSKLKLRKESQSQTRYGSTGFNKYQQTKTVNRSGLYFPLDS